MKIYIAASYPRKCEAIEIAHRLTDMGHEIVSGWLTEDEGYATNEEGKIEKAEHLVASSIRDLEEVKMAELVICLTDGKDQLTHGGRHSELGIALALDKEIMLIGEIEQVFHYHPKIIRFTAVNDLFYLCMLSYRLEERK